MVFVRSGGVQGDGTDHTKMQAQIFTRFGLTWHQKVHFSTFDGKLTFQSSRNGPSKPSILSRVSPRHLYYLFLDISPTYFSKNKLATNKISRIEHLKSQKPEI